MKSIMQEASTLAKAIETAWQRAGRPSEFTVKLLQDAQKNFFGFTTKPAKIALFFDGIAAAGQHRAPQQPARPQRPEREAREMKEGREQRPHLRRPQAPRPPEKESGPDHAEQMRPPRHERGPRRPDRGRPDRRPDRQDRMGGQERISAVWEPEMVQAANEWVRETLGMMGLSHIQTMTDISRNYLNITLDAPVDQDRSQQELLLKSWGNLAMDSLRDKFGQSLGGLRIALHVRP